MSALTGIQDPRLGMPVHYICTESHKCQAAFISTVGDSLTVMLHVLRPGDQADNPDQLPVERMRDIPYRTAAFGTPGTWHYGTEHSGPSV